MKIYGNKGKEDIAGDERIIEQKKPYKNERKKGRKKQTERK